MSESQAYGADWDDLLTAAADFQGVVPGAVLVGGTAVHVHHRFSTDADHVIGDLRQRFDALLAELDQRPDWRGARVRRPVMIMGAFEGVETTLRQLIRSRPLETIDVPLNVQGKEMKLLTVPTLGEMIRVKGWLALARNAFRDYLDLAALTFAAGPEGSQDALSSFDLCYRDVSSKKVDERVSPLLQLARQLADPMPSDLVSKEDVASYKGIAPRWSTWDAVASQCGTVVPCAMNALVSRNHEPALVLPEGLQAPPYPDATHRVFVSRDSRMLAIRRWDESEGAWGPIDNPTGPACVDISGRTTYVLAGTPMPEEEWERRTSPTPDAGPTRSGPPRVL
jgi:hypothetical protein